MNHSLLILGANDIGYIVKEIALSMGTFDKIDFLDDNPDCSHAIGECHAYEQFRSAYGFAFPAFSDNPTRVEWIKILEKAAFQVSSFIHPTAIISPSAMISTASLIDKGAIVNHNAMIANGSIIRAGAIVDFQTCIGFGCHIHCGAIVAPNAVMRSFTSILEGKVFDGKASPAFKAQTEKPSRNSNETEPYSFEIGV